MLGTSIVPYDLLKIIEDVDNKKLMIPDFQRDFVWKPEQIRKLLISILQGHFAGTFLLLEIKGHPPFAHKPVYGVGPCNGSSGNSEPDATTAPGGTLGNPEFYSILDGQQRISSVYYAFKHPPCTLSEKSKGKSKSTRHFFFLLLEKICESLETSSFLDEATLDKAVVAVDDKDSSLRDLLDKWQHGKAIPFGPIPPDYFGPPAHPVPHLITIYDLVKAYSPGATTTPQCASILNNYLEETKSPCITYKLYDALLPLLNYKFTAVLLNMPTSSIVQAITPIFVKVNSTGTKLTLFDLAVAYLYPYINLRNELKTFRSKYRGFAEEIKPDDILRVITLITDGHELEDAYVLRHLGDIAGKLSPSGSYSSSSGWKPGSFKDLWDEATECLKEAYDRILNRYGALKKEWIPYTSMLVPLAGFIHLKRNRKITDDDIDCWYWHSVFGERYEKSVNSIIIQDYNQILYHIKSGAATRPKWLVTVLTLDLKSVNNSQSALFRAVLNLIVLEEGAKCMINGAPVTSKSKDLELDHLFPRRKKGAAWFRHRWVNSILNITLLDSSTNKKKGSKNPSTFYFKDVFSGHNNKEENSNIDVHIQIQKTFASHLIGSKALAAFQEDKFEAFINAREADVLGKIKDLLSKCNPSIVVTSGSSGAESSGEKSEKD